jgi:ligand-binding sensor domain-containing protein/signal transduction histidine kinase/CheY-like chemotaxis protein
MSRAGVILIFIVACSTVRAQDNFVDLIFYKLTTSHGLSHNTVYSVAQDSTGFIWIGTREGLNRYDGSSITTLYADLKDSSRLSSNHITALEAGDNGVLHVGTANGFHLYNSRHQTFKKIYAGIENVGYVNKILKSGDGRFLVGGGEGLFMLSADHTNLETLLLDHVVLDITEFKRGIFLVATLHKVIMINEHGEILKEYTSVLNAKGQTVSLSENVFCIYKDSRDNVWLGSKKNGLFQYNFSEDTFEPRVVSHQFNTLEANAVRVIAEDAKGKLWLGTEWGVFIYDGGESRHYTQSFDQSPYTLSDKAIYEIYRSREGIMWIGTYFGGVNSVKPQEKGFKSLTSDGGSKKLSGKAISDIIQDKNKNLWIATEDGGVNIWNRKQNQLQYLKSDVGTTRLNVNNVHALYEDDDGAFWIGTFLGGVNKYNPKTKSINVFKKNQEEESAFTNNMVYAIYKDTHGDTWIGTTGGLHKFNKSKGTYESFHPELFNGKFIYEIYADRSGEVWICVMDSDGLYRYNPDTDTFTGMKTHEVLGSTPGFISVREDSKGRMWFGTVSRGLIKLDKATGNFKTYTVADGLPNNYVYRILEDGGGNLWMSTNRGLARFDPEVEEFTNYNISHGLPNNQFNYKSAFKDADGWMYFGTVNGLCYFHPDSLMLNKVAPATYLADLKLFNKSVSIASSGLLQNSINNTSEITLAYNENVITVDFGAINYYSSGSNQYAYYLQGFEADWNYVNDKNSATYTNLSPGTYIFKVKAANNDGVWADEAKQIKLIVLPPFWLTKWAMLVYAILIVGVFFLYRYILSYRNQARMALQLERIEREKINEINQHKLNFFTYISHEFKTPLTLIIAAIDKHLHENPLQEIYTTGYASIKRNAKRLHFLIEQLMEFRRVETDHARINYVKGDIIRFLNDTFLAFAPLFNKKNIRFYFNTDTSVFHAFFDADKLEKIVTNLVSNAAKYTSAEGSIEMDVLVKAEAGDKPDQLRIMIGDTGAGMSSEELQNVFTAFYQTEVGRKSGSGTGIGLALVKSLTDFLSGTIQIESKQAVGTQVVLTIPLPKSVQDSRVAIVEGNKTIDIDHVLPVQADDESLKQSNTPEYQLMIVEDSDELIRFLGEHFEKHYRVVKAFNGAEALEKIKISSPDVIVSDIMMPEMDGIELCRAIKADIATNHIPVILLTAKTTIENRLEGLNEGADAYLAKPFAIRELDLIIKNQLFACDKLRNHFIQFGSLKDLNVTVANRDQDFILKLTRIVEAHLDDTGFNITTFAQDACVSRSLLHLKMKKLVGLSASEFIRHIRLQKAAELLRTSDLNVTEIAARVGYADANYFSRSFKEKFQVNPTDFKHSVATEA